MENVGPAIRYNVKPRKVREYYPPISEEQRQAIILSNKTRTISDDTKKKMSKSRIGKGSKISKEQSKEIVEFYSSGKYNMVELAKMYNVGFTTIHSIIHGTRKMDKEQSECQE